MTYTLKIRKRLAGRILAGGLAVRMLCPPLSGLLPTAQAQAPVRDPNSPTVNGPALPPPIPVEAPEYGQTSILLFPFVNNTNMPVGDDIAAQVQDAVKFRLNSVGAFKVTTYSKFLAPVQRAVQDNVLADTDTGGPFADSQKAGKIAAEVDTNDYLIGAVESFKIDPTSRAVTLEVSADLRDTRTGNSIRTLAFTGASAPVSNSDTQDAVTQRAVGAVASKIASAINGNRRGMVMPTSQRGHNNGTQTFLLALLGGALIYAVLHSSNGTGGSSGTSTVISGTQGSGGTTTTTTSSGGPPSPPTGF